MQVRLIAAAAACVLFGHAATAQAVRDPAGPRELPPATYDQAQYVDSAGCVFLRAALNEQVIWVPRVTADRKPLCGYAPTFAGVPQVSEPVDVVAVPEPAPEAAPAEAPKPATQAETAAKPAAKAAKTKRRKSASVAAPAGPRCDPAAPLPAQVRLASGGTAVLCLSADKRIVERTSVISLSGATPFVEAPGTRVLVCPRGAKVVQRVALNGGGTTLLCTAGDGSLAGLAIPAPCKSKHAAKAIPQGSFVQVASFVVPQNAKRTKAWLAAQGLPVAKGRLTRRGQDFEVIFAGPFADAAMADAVLDAMRAAGFEDAFLR